MSGLGMRRPMRKALLAVLVLGPFLLAFFWAKRDPLSEPGPTLGAAASCSTCDARHRNIEKRAAAVQKLKEQK